MDEQRDVTKAPSSPRQRQNERQHAPGRSVPGRRASRKGGKAARASLGQLSPQQDAPVAPLVLPAAAGLSLPRLTGIPTRYGVHTEVSEGARLALALLQAEIADADDFEAGADPSSFIARSLHRLWTPEAIERFSLTYSFATVGDRFYFLISLNEGSYLDFTQPALVCDRAHEQLGPSLLTHLYACTPLLPAFTPEVCRDYIVCYHWEGWDEAENLLEMARCDLAYAEGVDEDRLSREEVETLRRESLLHAQAGGQPDRQALPEPRQALTGGVYGAVPPSRLPNLTRACELLSGAEGAHRGVTGVLARTLRDHRRV